MDLNSASAPFIFFDTQSSSDPAAKRWLFHQPREVRILTDVQDSDDYFAQLDEASEQCYVAGFMAYELGHWWVTGQAPASEANESLAWFGLFDAPVESVELTTPGSCRVNGWQDGQSKDDYASAIATIKSHIEQGNTYQVNYTFQSTFDWQGDVLGLYDGLRRLQPVPYGAVMNTGDTWVLSQSPELFFRREGTRINCEPMKGTAARGRYAEDDARIVAQMQSDEKTRAENAMIVDLLRNDVGQLCEFGSVSVQKPFTVEAYTTLHQMTSRVQGTLREGQSWSSILRALFPCGSVTGAPKRRTMELIQSLETSARGVYCGLMGFFHKDAGTFSVPIRTAVLNQHTGKGRLGIGSGIVYDSDTSSEYAECLLKGRFFQHASGLAAAEQDGVSAELSFSFIETMRCESGRIDLLARHISRLTSSARFWGRTVDWPIIDSVLPQKLPAEGIHKVRLLVGPDGGVSLDISPLDEAAWHGKGIVTLCADPIDQTSRWLFHKTTQRERYDETYAIARACGLDEVLFQNQAGFLTEGCISTVWVKQGAVWVTPCLDHGVLPGVLRSHLLATRDDYVEGDIRASDIGPDTPLQMGNALRGLRSVRFVPPSPKFAQKTETAHRA